MDTIENLERENKILKEKLNKIEEISKSKRKKRFGILKFIGAAIAGKKLKDSIYVLLDEYNSQRHITRDSFSNFLANLIQRLTRVGVATILFAVLPSILLMRQNMLLKQQNQKIQEQTHLAEASRRSSQMFIMGEVLSDVNKELETKRTLSNTLTGRVISLSRAMKPYRYINGDTLIEKPISPERGQLLITLCKSNIQSGFFVDMLQESDFTQAELTNSNLSHSVLTDINLKGANLKGSEVTNVNFSYAILSNANLTNVDFTDANLKNADLTNANLTNADLRYTKLDGADFTNAKLDNVKVHRRDWLHYITNKIKLKGAEKINTTYKIDSVYFKDYNKKILALVRE